MRLLNIALGRFDSLVSKRKPGTNAPGFLFYSSKIIYSTTGKADILKRAPPIGTKVSAVLVVPVLTGLCGNKPHRPY